jgi:ankyrin repeat protein
MTDDQQLVALVEAAKAGDLAAVNALLLQRPELAMTRLTSGESALMAAVYRGHRDVVQTLLERGAATDIFASAATGRFGPLRLNLIDGADVNAVAYDGWTALHLAAFFGHFDAAEVLLDAGADVHAVSHNSLKNTPLHAAAAGKHSEVALLLIERGANPAAVDAGGYTPLQIARENGLTEVLNAIG